MYYAFVTYGMKILDKKTIHDEIIYYDNNK